MFWMIFNFFLVLQYKLYYLPPPLSVASFSSCTHVLHQKPGLVLSTTRRGEVRGFEVLYWILALFYTLFAFHSFIRERNNIIRGQRRCFAYSNKKFIVLSFLHPNRKSLCSIYFTFIYHKIIPYYYLLKTMSPITGKITSFVTFLFIGIYINANCDIY